MAKHSSQTGTHRPHFRAQKRSAGLLLYRRVPAGIEVFLVHPGGPFWTRRDRGAWMLPKGECQPGEELFVTAQREFQEETGFPLPSKKDSDYLPLGMVRTPTEREAGIRMGSRG